MMFLIIIHVFAKLENQEDCSIDFCFRAGLVIQAFIHAYRPLKLSPWRANVVTTVPVPEAINNLWHNEPLEIEARLHGTLGQKCDCSNKRNPYVDKYVCIIHIFPSLLSFLCWHDDTDLYRFYIGLLITASSRKCEPAPNSVFRRFVKPKLIKAIKRQTFTTTLHLLSSIGQKTNGLAGMKPTCEKCRTGRNMYSENLEDTLTY